MAKKQAAKKATPKKTAKPMSMKTTTARIQLAPREPNCTRDWIICGMPRRGPCTACSAVKMVPNRVPATSNRLAMNTSPMASKAARNSQPKSVPITCSKWPLRLLGAICQPDISRAAYSNFAPDAFTTRAMRS